MTPATATKPGVSEPECPGAGDDDGGERLAERERSADRTRSEDESRLRAVRLRALVNQHYDFVWRSVRRLGVAAAHAEDAAQQVFWVAARKLDRIAPAAERAFLFSTAARTASDWRRVQGRLAHREVSDDEWLNTAVAEGEPPDTLLEQKRGRELLDRLLDELPHELRAVLILAEGEQMTLTEMSEVLEVPRGTVASRLRRARIALEALAQGFSPSSGGQGVKL